MEKQKLYESPLLRRATGPTLRPGGLALTGRALDLCLERFGLKHGDAVLDLGCGPGETLALLRSRGFRACGLDRSPILLAEAAARIQPAKPPDDSPPSHHPGLPLCRADASSPPLKPACLNAVICECVLSLLPDPARTLAACRKALRPGGLLLLSDLVSSVPDSGFPAESCAAAALHKDALLRLIRANGFSILHQSDKTRSLKELAARLILEYGSANAFFRRREDGRAACQPNPVARLGYWLIIAKAERIG